VRDRAEWTSLSLATVCVAALSLVVVASALTAPKLRAQSSSDSNDRPRYEVASIKPNNSGNSRMGGRGLQPGGRLSLTNVPLEWLVLIAYQVGSNALISGPEWKNLLSERFDIEAKVEGNPTQDKEQPLLQALLEDRFKLLVHHETRLLPVYALVLTKPGKTGPQLKAHSPGTTCLDLQAGPPLPGTGFIAPCGSFAASITPPVVREAGNKVTADMLAADLSRFTDRHVLNRTGLTGEFDETLVFAGELQQGNDPLANIAMAPTDPSGPPSIFTAVQEQLGLKLESTTGPVDVLVIDHVEEPSPN
jgi:uncharacterized protein (TIGR03435 family)